MSDYFELQEVLLAELKSIEEGRKTLREEEYYSSRAGGERGETAEQQRSRKEAALTEVFTKLHAAELKALCLSGGGIRSATFNLGVLQALAKNGVLKEIDYLSTVSGGGYIGSWLSSWIARQGRRSATPVDDVIVALAQQDPAERCSEPCQVRFLRDYSNYLTPRVGLLSIDSWAILATYLRNLFLNWLVLIPLFSAFLLLPRLATGLIVQTGGTGSLALPALGALLGSVPIAYTIIDLPSIGDRKRRKGNFILFFLTPLVLMACVLSAYWAQVYHPGCVIHDRLAFVRFGRDVHVMGWGFGILWLLLRERFLPPLRATFVALCAAVVAGSGAGLLGHMAATKLLPKLHQAVQHPSLIYATFSVPVVLTVCLLSGALVVALLSAFTGEEDREWWGRCAGVIILCILLWSGLMAVVTYGPWLILPESLGMWTEAYAMGGTVFGVGVALLGKAAATPALRPAANMGRLRTTALSVAAALFLLFLMQILSLLASFVFWLERSSRPALQCLREVALSCMPIAGSGQAATPFSFDTHLNMICDTSLSKVAIVAAVATVVAFFMAFFVNVNKFSMHAMYRNRLVRCYLGASRDPEERDPNPFSGFDKEDDLHMSKLPTRPFHVVNMAWNLVKGKRLAWQQRKAASFIMTPLFAGADIDAVEENGVLPGGFREIEKYGSEEFRCHQPMTVGTAMAISGAAASPNMGYHSSPLVTFVMALFNVRLGWWLGNPGKNMGRAWRKSSPSLAVGPLFRETFGFTEESSDYVYLSDGGHFENLALYEMVRRRCRYIIVCDSGCDGDYSFMDLGNAVRKVRADFGIEIVIDLAGLKAKKTHFAVGRVKYSTCDESEVDGTLLYLKPVLTEDEPVDDFSYRKTHPEFPHESTADQWFDEAQFESYRRLGLHSVEELMDGEWAEINVQNLMKKAALLHDSVVEKLRKQQPPAAS